MRQGVKDIGYEIRTIHNLIEKRQKNKDIPNDMALTPMQCWTIGFLYYHQDKDIYQKDVENEFNISGATATNMLQVMEKKGLIIRNPVKQDARLKKIILTNKAVAMHKDAVKNIKKMEDILRKNMTKEEVVTLIKLLTKVRCNLEEDAIKEGESEC